MHLQSATLQSDLFPKSGHYPFHLDLLKVAGTIRFRAPVTFFCGENGSGKTTILEAIAERCAIKIWKEDQGNRFRKSPHEGTLARYTIVEWCNGPVPGSFFGSRIFHNFTRLLDAWAATDPALLDYFGGQSLLSRSHGESLMAFFRSRYRIPGLYLLDEPETALSPASQLELLSLLHRMAAAGHAQFVIATHSPLLLACPGAEILHFRPDGISPIDYEETEYFLVYRDFLGNRQKYIENLEESAP
jgi:predicted ATPase